MLLCTRCKSPCQENHRFCPECGLEISDDTPGGGQGKDPFIGVTIGKKFVLRQLIGSGGMGNVYKAEQKRVGRTVAVKIMHRHLLEDERAVARFINEARAASQLNHPHSISVLDFGQTEAGLLFMVMEYLRGKSLDQVVEEEFPIPFGRIADILCQVMDAVEAAHRLNIIHRDLKPENVFLEGTVGQDFVKVLDFGVAKILERESGRTITTPGLVPGTPEYMSPEQARGWPLDARSDVYSLGVILYEMLTSSVPFKGGSALETMMSHVQDPPPPPSERRADRNIPPALDSIVLWALAKEPSERISSSAQFRDILSAWAEVSGIWPKKSDTSEKPVAEQTNVLAEFFGEDAIAEQEVGEHEAQKVQERDQLRLKDTAFEVALQPWIHGRRHQYARLKEFLSEPTQRVLGVRASTGMGKASLVEQTVSKAGRPDIDVVHCLADTGWSRVSLAPIHRAISACLSLPIKDFKSIGAVEHAATNLLGMDTADIPGLIDLMGTEGMLTNLQDDGRRRERLVAFRNLARRAATYKPLLLIFEDYDLYDQPSRDLVSFLIEDPGDDELKILVTHEDDYEVEWPVTVEYLEVPPLEQDDTRGILLAMFDREDPEQIARISEASGGNPLFLRQIAFAEVFEEILSPPDRVADLVAARMERLPQAERETLQWMAMVNEPMETETIAMMMPAANDDLLESLVNKGFLQYGDRLYSFVHRQIALVIFSSIPAEVRRRQHQVVAEQLRARKAPVTDVAYHSYEAEDGPHALDELCRAGNWAVRCLDYKGAVLWYSRAMEIVRKEWGKGRMEAFELDDLAVDLAHRMARALRANGDTITARGTLEETLSVAAGKASSRAELRLELGRIYLDMGNLQRAARHLQLARSDLETAPAEVRSLKWEVSRQLARVLGLLGQREDAGRLIMESVAEESKNSKASWAALLESAVICYQIGLPDRARGFLLDSLQQADAERNVNGKMKVLIRMAEMHMNSKEWHMAEMRLSQAIDLITSQRTGDRTLEVKLKISVGWLRRVQNNLDQARQLLENALEMARSISYHEGMKRANSELQAVELAISKQG